MFSSVCVTAWSVWAGSFFFSFSADVCCGSFVAADVNGRGVIRSKVEGSDKQCDWRVC